MAAFEFDTRVRIQVTWRQNGQEIDPTTTTLRYEKPDGTVVVDDSNGGLINPSTGIYYLDVDVAASGEWEYRFEADSPKGVIEGFFVVKRSRIDTLNP